MSGLQTTASRKGTDFNVLRDVNSGTRNGTSRRNNTGVDHRVPSARNAAGTDMSTSQGWDRLESQFQMAGFDVSAGVPVNVGLTAPLFSTRARVAASLGGSEQPEGIGTMEWRMQWTTKNGTATPIRVGLTPILWAGRR